MERLAMVELRELAHRLELSAAERRAFLEEVTGDLEDLYVALRARGLGPAAAWRAAADMLLPDDAALRELGRVHRPLFVRLTERLTSSGAGTADVVMVVALSVVIFASTLVALLNGGVLAPISWALAPTLAAGVLACVLIARTTFRVATRAEPRPDRVRREAHRIAVAGALALGAGILSAGWGFVRVVTVATRGTGATPVLLTWIPTAVAQLSVGLIVALQCGVAWLLLTRYTTRLESDVARTLARVRGFHFPGAAW
jgi:hypothetical protein